MFIFRAKQSGKPRHIKPAKIDLMLKNYDDAH